MSPALLLGPSFADNIALRTDPPVRLVRQRVTRAQGGQPGRFSADAPTSLARGDRPARACLSFGTDANRVATLKRRTTWNFRPSSPSGAGLARDLKIGAVPHGFRSSFRDWAAECTDAPREVCEIALAHVNTDRVEAAYRRTDLFDRRRRLMTDWAAYLA